MSPTIGAVREHLSLLTSPKPANSRTCATPFRQLATRNSIEERVPLPSLFRNVGVLRKEGKHIVAGGDQCSTCIMYLKAAILVIQILGYTASALVIMIIFGELFLPKDEDGKLILPWKWKRH